ncbi:hypothetical protein [Bryobacter aggregatus]|uniref:hypothetical protein n=1 Tax=Bryobacter aggregatus TaxID=360054 RepID=UPI0004E1DE24|nr:hypothetical protein [Bryobacter aggregatus]
MSAGISLFYSAAQDAAALAIRTRLNRLTDLQVAHIGVTRESFLEDLADACSSGDALIVLLSQDILPEGGSPREVYAPLLERIESHAPTAIVTLNSLPLPPLLAKSKRADWATSPVAALRQIEAWSIAWRPRLPEPEIARPQVPVEVDAGLLEALFARLIDNTENFAVSHPSPAVRTQFGQHFATLARPHFEAVHWVEAPHQVAALRDGALKAIVPGGRALWIVNGYDGDPILPPAQSSILSLRTHGAVGLPDLEIEETAPLDPYAMLRATPSHEGETLPFCTFEFERSLPELFQVHWSLGERVARKAGSFFRVNHRVAEAIWLYELLLAEASARGHAQCVADCENELYWLRAGGERKVQLMQASQASLF